MPAKTGTSAVTGKLNSAIRSAFNKAKTNEVDYGSGGDLPAGIEMGVAQVIKCGFGKYKTGKLQGKDFFLASGIVHRPVEHDGMKVAGLRTQIGPEPLCDTPDAGGKRKTLQDHADWVMNELKKMAVDADSLDFSKDGVVESVMKSIEESKPWIRFRTWKGEKATEGPYAGKEPRVVHEWKGATDEPSGVESTESYENDNTSGEAPSEEPTSEETTETDSSSEEASSEELDTLLEQANSSDETESAVAANRLAEIAREMGISDDDITGAESWEELVGMIRLGPTTDEVEGERESEAETEESWEPKIKEIYNFRPVDPKTKKKVSKAVECVITAVQKDKQTVHVTNNVTKKPYADLKTKKPIAVKWDDLESAE